MIAFIDPGVKYFGWAVFSDAGSLEAAGKNTRDGIAEVTNMAWEAEIEKPWVDQRGKGKSRLEDVMELCIAAGWYGGHFAACTFRTPYKAPKDIRHERAVQACRPEELLVLPKQITYRKHTLCAVYMGMRRFGRIVA